jgi:hypothetical protein
MGAVLRACSIATVTRGSAAPHAKTLLRTPLLNALPNGTSGADAPAPSTAPERGCSLPEMRMMKHAALAGAWLALAAGAIAQPPESP